MKFLKENINTISKEASLFTQEHPEYKDKIKAFEEYFEVDTSLKHSKYLISLITDFDYIGNYENNYYDEYGSSVSVFCDNWDKPYIEEIKYAIEDNQLRIQGYLIYEGKGSKIITSRRAMSIRDDDDYDEYDTTIVAYYDFDIAIPDDVVDGDYKNNDSGFYYEEY
ncbi:hypothetical protein [uncultured Clostridium sp.]|uniref:hypothetical protein n=1 Tax=uncultured Clostridium sp. TaxID=59620 RepID=UPI0026191D4C|nr:hypothetical protein [uncultured Clostridium sp.]